MPCVCQHNLVLVLTCRAYLCASVESVSWSVSNLQTVQTSNSIRSWTNLEACLLCTVPLSVCFTVGCCFIPYFVLLCMFCAVWKYKVIYTYTGTVQLELEVAVSVNVIFYSIHVIFIVNDWLNNMTAPRETTKMPAGNNMCLDSHCQASCDMLMLMVLSSDIRVTSKLLQYLSFTDPTYQFDVKSAGYFQTKPFVWRRESKATRFHLQIVHGKLSTEPGTEDHVSLLVSINLKICRL